jgi:hypothetical protein
MPPARPSGAVPGVAEIGGLVRRLADRPAEGRVFIAPGELDEAAATEAAAVATRWVAVAVTRVDMVGEGTRVGAIGLGRGAGPRRR